ncbi:hypothetical protein QBC33DRAFT_519407 [Phialemonium atrogriseum]|uniref:HNH nuclease domain-containing protein n=1 Tax=Phialemonium atrogriseum TaxID=1093897 RepID=A0AAJ0FGS8_9PEZI|nr:uncharacterized protein QBC33DRAFT_519407 [Phialemonium atrogriseum]KAK1762658.1 hypothetical protein QBC33DRAFT_519407 [Phialemonium atrogriseum]
MFDTDVAYLIKGTDIDRPRNGMTLSHNLHLFFGDFQVFFEPVPDQPPHTYRIGTFLSRFTVGSTLPTPASSRSIVPSLTSSTSLRQLQAASLNTKGTNMFQKGSVPF